MKNQSFPHHKILPVKQLVQNQKHKKQFLFLANRQTRHQSSGYHTPRTTQSVQSSPSNLRLDSPIHYCPLKPYETSKNTSVNNSFSNQMKYGHQIATKNKYNKPIQQYYFQPKSHNNFLTESQKICGVKKQQPVRRMAVDLNLINFGQNQQECQLRTNARQPFQSITLSKEPGDMDKFGSYFSQKSQDETWNASKILINTNPENQSQTFYQNQINKLKSELSSKETNIFELSQKLEEKQRTLNNLTKRQNTNKQAIGVSGVQTSLKNQNLILQIKRLSSLAANLSKELEKSQECASTNKKLLILKTKQFQIDQQQKTKYIIQLKEKEKKNAINCQKLINGQKQLLKQKQLQLIKVSEAAQFYKEQVSKKSSQIEFIEQKLNLKDQVIRELSGQISDLKDNLHEFELRIKEMIQTEDDLRKQLQNKSNNDQIQKIIEKIKKQLSQKNNQIEQLRKDNTFLNNQLYEIKQRIRQESSVKDFQLAMMQKTCDDYKQKLSQYQRCVAQSKNKSFYEQQFIEVKRQSQSPHLNPNKSPRKSVSLIRDQAQYKKIKQLNVRLFRDNDKMNSRIKDLNSKLNQSDKLNKDLNQMIIKKQLIEMEAKFKRRAKIQ